MFARFSVKKPFTVLVAVILVIVLGVVAFGRMTPDLLPGMEFPYAVVVTAYPGASPEEVEREVTKPLEQSLAALDGVNSVGSTSSENYSMLTLEFADGTNMDAATMNMREQINLISGSWSEYVGTPTIIRIDPNMLPVTVAAVSYEGKDTAELSEFVESTILPKLEGIDGVASVSATGLIKEKVQITIDSDLVDKANSRISDAILEKFEEAKDEVEVGIGSAESGLSQLDAGREAIMKGQVELTKQIDSAKAQMTSGRAQLVELQNNKPTMESALNTASTEYANLDAGLAALRQTVRSSDPAYANLTDAEVDAILGAGDSATNPFFDSYKLITDGYAMLDSSLAAFGVTREGIPGMLETLATVESKIAAIDTALADLETQRTSASAAIYDKLVDIAAGKAALTMTVTQLESALSEIESQQEAALESADLTGILTRDTVSMILTAQNFAMPAGYIEGADGDTLVSVGDKVQDVEELRNLMLMDPGIEGVEPVRLGEVAKVEVLDNSGSTYAVLDGESGVLFSFQKQSGDATATVSENITSEFRSLEAAYPGLKFVSLMDQGDYIRIVVDSVLENLLLGGVLAVIILLLFLKDLRPTLITALSIPISVTFAIVLMYFSGVTLNIISLSGLAVGVGMLVDNSIVVIENIYRLRQLGENPIKAAISGTIQVAGAITGSTLTTVCVFFPIVFVEGITRQIFVDMALTIAYSLLASLIVALTLVPAMASGMLRNQKQKEDKGYRRLTSGYQKVLGFALRHRALFIILSVVLLAGSCYAAISRGFQFMPATSSTQISVTVTMPEDSLLEDTADASGKVVEGIMAIEGVDSVGAMLSGSMSGIMGMGLGGGDDEVSADSVTMYVMLDAESGADSADVCRQIEALAEGLPCEVSADDGSGMSSASSMLGGSGVSVRVYCEDLDILKSTAEAISQKLGSVEGIAESHPGISETVAELRISVDKDKAMQKGLTVAEIYQTIAARIAGSVTATSITYDGSAHDVLVQGDKSLTAEELRGMVLTVSGAAGTKEVKLSEIATIKNTETLGSISRSEQRRYLTVSGTLEAGYNVSLVAAEAKEAIDSMALPLGVTVEFSGENETIMDAMVDLLKMLGLGIVIVYLIMVAQFQSLLSPFIVMFTIPLAFTGGMLALLIADMEVSVVSMIGFVMLVGIIVNNGIVLIDAINLLRQEGMERREAIIEASSTRIRPVIMTALTTILGLVPLAMGVGVGAELMQPVAVVCIGGLTYATLMTLLIVPVMYDILAKRPPSQVSAEDMLLSEK